MGSAASAAFCAVDALFRLSAAHKLPNTAANSYTAATIAATVSRIRCHATSYKNARPKGT